MTLLLLGIQSDQIDQSRTTIAISLGKYSKVKGQVIPKRCPIVATEGVEYVALMQQLSGIERTSSGANVINVLDYKCKFIDVIDLTISGI